MNEYSQGICEDGAAILKNGQPMTIEEVIAELREREELKAYQADLVKELTSCQSVLFMLARDGEVTPAYANDAKLVLNKTPAQSLVEHNAKVIEKNIPAFKDPSTNNGDWRTDASYRMGWNACRAAMQHRVDQMRGKQVAA